MKIILSIASLFIATQVAAIDTYDRIDSAKKSQFALKKAEKKAAVKTYYWSNSKEVCINVNGLISQIVPFNLKEVDNGLTTIKTKWYGKKNALRTELGIDIGDITSKLYVGIAGEKRKPIYKQIHYTTGTGGFIMIDNTRSSNFENLTIIGVSKFYGLEYHFNNRIFVGTEARFSIGVGSEIKIEFLPPVALFAGVRL